MSIAQVINIKQDMNYDLDKLFGKNEGYWEYRDKDDNFVCYTVRKRNDKGKKYFLPYTPQNGKLIPEWFVDNHGQSLIRPLYNVRELYLRPDVPVLLVEGEKTADAGKLFFPEMVSVTWLGGSGMANFFDISHLFQREVYLVPDPDEGGIKAGKVILKTLLNMGNTVHYVDVKLLGLTGKWDIANLHDETGVIAVEDFLQFLRSTPVYVEPDPELEFSSYPDLSDSRHPRPLDTRANFKHLLDHYHIKARWNMMSRVRDVTVPTEKFYIEERDNAALHYITDLAVTHGLPTNRVDKHLDAISWADTYHPVRDWILSAPLTQHDVFNKFLSTIKTTDNDFSYLLLKRWMLSAVYSVFTDTSFCAQGVLVIQGLTGTHKSSFVMSLAPPSLRAIKGGLSVDPSKKDDIFTSAEYWIAELGELDATFRKADIARLKSHITNDIDDVRRPHAVRNSRMIRRTVYAATVNESRFLVDTTGNRRWWTISITEPINTRHGLDMQQVWRFIYECYLKGESPFLNHEEMARLHETNKEFEFLDPFEEKLDTYFNWNVTDRLPMNSTEVLERLGYDKPSKSDCTRMGCLLTKRGIRKGVGRLRYSYYMPLFKTGNN